MSDVTVNRVGDGTLVWDPAFNEFVGEVSIVGFPYRLSVNETMREGRKVLLVRAWFVGEKRKLLAAPAGGAA